LSFRNVLVKVLFGLILPVQALAVEVDPYEKYLDHSTYNEDLDVPWVELETQVKQLPRDEDLVEVELARLPPSMKLYIDLENIVIGKDDVTRVWLVARSSSGAYNATYEGLRCADRTYKVYAYYNPKRSTPLRVIELPAWKDATRSNNYRSELMEDFVCSGSIAEPPSDIADNIQRQAGSYDSPYR